MRLRWSSARPIRWRARWAPVALVGEDELRAPIAVQDLDRAPRPGQDGPATRDRHVELEQLAGDDTPVFGL